MSNILKGLNEGRSYGRDSWDSNMPGYQGDYGGAENFGRRKREWDEDDRIDARIRAEYEQKKQYEQNGKFWLKLKDSQRHLPAGPFVGKQSANQAAIDLLKQQPELKGNLVITAYGPDEQVNELSNNTLASYKKKAGADASAADKAGDYKRGDKRMSGIVKATKKQFDNDAKGVAEAFGGTSVSMPSNAAGTDGHQQSIDFYNQEVDNLAIQADPEFQEWIEAAEEKLVAAIRNGKDFTHLAKVLSAQQVKKFGGKTLGQQYGSQMAGKADAYYTVEIRNILNGPVTNAGNEMTRRHELALQLQTIRSGWRRMSPEDKQNLADQVGYSLEELEHFVKTGQDPEESDLRESVKQVRPATPDELRTGYTASKSHAVGADGNVYYFMDPKLKQVGLLRNKQQGVAEDQLDELKCWSGYTRVQGVPAGAPGSCKKKTNEEGVAEAELDEAKAKRTVEDIFIKGKKVGSITTTTTKSGMIFYTAQVGNSFVAGSDTREEAMKDLKRLYRDYYTKQDVAEGYQFKGPFPFDVDHMHGGRGINLPKAETKKYFTDKKQWQRAVDDINSSKYDDNSDYIGVTGRSTVEINGREWARWSDAQQKGYIELSSMSEQGVAEEQHSCPHCGGPMFSEMIMNEKKDACYYKVKSRYKVWPSAYASGALVKCRKKGADNWGTGGKKNESSILEGIEQVDENLNKWFKEKWVRFGPDGKIRGDCARGDDSEGKPKCLPQSKAHSLGKKGRASAAARKRREDPNPERSGKAINVNTKKKSNEGVAESYPKHQDLSGISTEKLKAYLAKQAKQSVPGEGSQVKRVQAELQRRSQGVAEEQLDEKWSQKYKDSINCSNPKGFSQKAHCQGKNK